MKLTILGISLAIFTDGCTGDDDLDYNGWWYFSFVFLCVALYVIIEDIVKWKI